jgi:hypothetical protein
MRIQRILVLTALSLTSGLLLATAASAAVEIGVSVNIAPPELPVYEQPPIPGPDYIWSPGYWAWGSDDYYWVPGTWVQAPEPGFLWTPGYWGWAGGGYLWHAGYWGPHVGFYGGVNYGFGYGGRGYEGGEWREGRFFYNRSVNNIPENVHVTNVYNRTVVNNVTVNRVSFNGGNGGIAAQASAAERADANERHLPPVGEQMHHEQAARSDPQLRAGANHGAPPIAATAHPAAFSGPGVVGARGAGPVHPGNAHADTVHAGPAQPGMTHSGPTPGGLADQASQATHHGTGAMPGPSHPAQVVAPHPGPTPPGTAQSAAHTFRPSTPGGGMGPGGGGHAPPAPKVEHQAPPAHAAPPHGGSEHGGNAEHEHDHEH